MNYLSKSISSGFVSLPLTKPKGYSNFFAISSYIKYHVLLVEFFLCKSMSMSFYGGFSSSEASRLKKKAVHGEINNDIDSMADKFNYYYWGYLSSLASLASGLKDDIKYNSYANTVFDAIDKEIAGLLRFISHSDGNVFSSTLIDMAVFVADRSLKIKIPSSVSPSLQVDDDINKLIKIFFVDILSNTHKNGIRVRSKHKTVDDSKFIENIKSKIFILVKKLFCIEGIDISKDTLKEFVDIFILALIKIRRYRDKFISEARSNDYFKSEFKDYSHNIDLELIIEGKKIISDDSWLDELDELDDKFNKSKSKSKSKNKSKNKKSKPDDINQNKEQDSICLFKYQENCDLDVFIKKLPADKNFARLSQLSLKYRIFIKGKVAVFPGMEINDFDLLLIPKGLEKIRRHHLDISLSELEASFQVNDKCSFDSSNLMEMLGERPGKGSGLSSHLCDNYMSVPGYRDYVRYHGFINQWFKLVGKPVDIEVSYHHDSKDILQKLLTLNYLSVCSGLRELHIDYSNNICKVGEVILPKKTEEALKLQKPEDKSKFPFLYIGHQDSIEAERGKYDFEKLLKKNLKRFSEEEHKGIKFKDIIDWSGVEGVI